MAQGGQQAFAQGDDLFLVSDVLEQDRKLVTPEPRHEIVGPHAEIEAPRNLLQNLVTRGMTETVVDDLEPIQIQVHHGELVTLIGPAARYGYRQALMKAVAIGEV